jgi:hypothetical protein
MCLLFPLVSYTKSSFYPHWNSCRYVHIYLNNFYVPCNSITSQCSMYCYPIFFFVSSTLQVGISFFSFDSKRRRRRRRRKKKSHERGKRKMCDINFSENHEYRWKTVKNKKRRNMKRFGKYRIFFQFSFSLFLTVEQEFMLVIINNTTRFALLCSLPFVNHLVFFFYIRTAKKHSHVLVI